MRIPKMGCHRQTGQARVIYRGKHYYLGKFGSEEAAEAYKSFISKVINGEEFKAEVTSYTVAVAMVQYLEYCKGYYGEKEAGNVKTALRLMARKFGTVELANLGPSVVSDFIQGMANSGDYTRYRCNKVLAIWKRFYRWLAVKELIKPEKLAVMNAIPGIKLGRSAARETEPVKAPPIEDFNRLVSIAPPHVADLLNLQLLLACRPGELVSMKPGLVDRSKPVWVYTPSKHKNQHRGHQRKILIGPKAQVILAKYLFRGDDEYCWPSEKILDCHYQVHSYEQELKRLSQRAGIEKILPNQVRHLAATVIHERYGWEAARQMLGHKTVGTTQFYVEELLTNAGKVASEIG